MRNFLKVITFLWFGFCVFGIFEILLYKNEITEKEQSFINTQILPAVRFVTDFQLKEKHLPSKREFFLWEREYFHDFSINVDDTINTANINILTKYNKTEIDLLAIDFKNKLKDFDWSKDYVLEVWNGEWFWYYFSSSDTFYKSNYTHNDAIIGVSTYLILGITPLVFWYRNNKKKLHIT
jgi:hypothetical protein